MKYKNSLYGGIFLLIIVGITILLDVKTISEINMIHIICLIIPLAIIVMSLIKIKETKQTIQNGEKTRGYIIDVNCYDTTYIFDKCISGTIKIYVNGKIKIIDNIIINDKYKELYDKVNKMYYIDDKVNVKGIPVDVYINNDEIYVDLESVDV